MRTRFGFTTGFSVAILWLVQLSTVSLAHAEEEKKDWSFKWSNGFKLDSLDGKFKLKFGGRIQADWTFVDASREVEAAFGSFEDGNEFRRARLFFEGTIYERVEFKAQYDFAGGDADFKDVYIGIKKTPIGNLRIGHFKEPFSIEELTSSKYITFLERSLPNVFSPSRNTGFMLHDQRGDRFTWAVGAFRETADTGIGSGNGKLNLTGRLTFLPIYEEKGRRLLHLGLSYSQKDLGDDAFRYRQRPEAHQSPRLVDTGSFRADSAQILDLEVAAVAGPLWAMAEYFQTEADSAALGDPSLDSYYVQAGFFLTGEHRVYKTSAGAFDRLKPKSNFGKDGKGAWEIAARFSTLDLTDKGLTGGELDDFSVALNWYLNPATRFMWNYVSADRSGVGSVDYILFRTQVDF